MQKKKGKLNININLQDWRRVEDELPNRSCVILAYDDEDDDFRLGIRPYPFVASFVPKKYRTKKRRRTCLELYVCRTVFFTHWIPFERVEIPDNTKYHRRWPEL